MFDTVGGFQKSSIFLVKLYSHKGHFDENYSTVSSPLPSEIDSVIDRVSGAMNLHQETRMSRTRVQVGNEGREFLGSIARTTGSTGHNLPGWEQVRVIVPPACLSLS